MIFSVLRFVFFFFAFNFYFCENNFNLQFMEDKKYKWEFEDFRKLGLAFASFLKKGRVVNNNVLLPELDENISCLSNTFYKSLIDVLVFGYFSQMEGKQEKPVGKRQNWKKGETAAMILYKDINNAYLNEWGGEIDFESLTNFAGKKKAVTKTKQEQAKERTREEKQKRLNNILSCICNLIDEFHTINNEIGDNEIKNKFIEIINNHFNGES